MENSVLKTVLISVYESLDNIIYHMHCNCLTEGDINEAKAILDCFHQEYEEAKKEGAAR